VCITGDDNPRVYVSPGPGCSERGVRAGRPPPQPRRHARARPSHVARARPGGRPGRGPGRRRVDTEGCGALGVQTEGAWE